MSAPIAKRGTKAGTSGRQRRAYPGMARSAPKQEAFCPIGSLTQKRETFCQEYVRIGKATAAYRKAYDASKMSQHAVEVEASRLLHHPEVSLRVAELRRLALERFEVDASKIALGWARIAYADLRDAFDPVTGALLRPENMPEDLAMALTSIEVVELPGRKGQEGPVYVKKVRLADRKGALDSLGRWKRMLVERVEHEHVDPNDVRNLTDEQLEAEIRANAEALKVIERANSRKSVKVRKPAAKQ